MYAVEFETKIQNGIVHIPQEYKDLIESTSARFVVMYDHNDKIKVNNIKKRMSAISIDTSTFTFNRDEANER